MIANFLTFILRLYLSNIITPPEAYHHKAYKFVPSELI